MYDQSPASVPASYGDEIPPLSFEGLFRLFLQPREFFTRCLEEDTNATRAFALFVTGAAAVIGNLDMRLFEMIFRPEKARMGTNPALLELMSHWMIFWPYVCFIGIIAAMFDYWILGGFYYLRVRLAGDREASFRDARSVMLYSTFASDFLLLVALLFATTSCKSYYDIYLAVPEMFLVFALLPFWGIYISYRGVRAIFDVNRWQARIWFLILPLLFYSGHLALTGAVLSVVKARAARLAAAKHMTAAKTSTLAAAPADREETMKDKEVQPSPEPSVSNQRAAAETLAGWFEQATAPPESARTPAPVPNVAETPELPEVPKLPPARNHALPSTPLRERQNNSSILPSKTKTAERNNAMSPEIVEDQNIAPLSTLTVSTILCEGTKCIAVINGHTVRPGEEYSGYKVVKIEPELVTLQAPGQEPVQLEP